MTNQKSDTGYQRGLRSFVISQSWFVISGFTLLAVLSLFAHQQGVKPPDFSFISQVLKGEAAALHADLAASPKTLSHPQHLPAPRPTVTAALPQALHLPPSDASTEQPTVASNQLASAGSSSSAISPDPIPILMYHYVR